MARASPYVGTLGGAHGLLASLYRFTSSEKEMFEGDAGVVVTTYTMIAYTGRRSEESQKVMDMISSREWGLLLLDEVHVVPANMFRKVGSDCVLPPCRKTRMWGSFLSAQRSSNARVAFLDYFSRQPPVIFAQLALSQVETFHTLEA